LHDADGETILGRVEPEDLIIRAPLGLLLPAEDFLRARVAHRVHARITI
jgi:hypothetical protein